MEWRGVVQTLLWAPGHAWIRRNECADIIANKAGKFGGSSELRHRKSMRKVIRISLRFKDE